MDSAAQIEIAEAIRKASETREASYVRTPDNHYDFGHYTKSMYDACLEVSGDPRMARLLDLVLYWSNDAHEWADGVLGKQQVAA